MSQLQLFHSPDIRRLRDAGYEVDLGVDGYLIIHNIPYVNSNKEIKYGKLVSALELRDESTTAQPKDHVILFEGEHPCNKNGEILNAIKHQTIERILPNGIRTNYSFSNKPTSGYTDYFHKFSRYEEIITSHAKSIDSSVTARTFKKIYVNEDKGKIFNYVDTNSSRANLEIVNRNLYSQKIGIIGLGGTGAYVLDLISKSPVSEIHIFDADSFDQHNAFRAPGAPSIEELKSHESKVSRFGRIYGNIHSKIIAHYCFVDEPNFKLLSELDFVFICVDNSESRIRIISYLVDANISFIDTGLGMNLVDDKLIGSIRLTTGTKEMTSHLDYRIPKVDIKDEIYISNIQIAELNSLNAALAVIKWKKLSGFYQDLTNAYHSVFTINDSCLHNEDIGS